MAIDKCFLIPQRVITAIMGFLAIVNAYTMRICLSMAMTDLVISKNHTLSNSSGICFDETNLDDAEGISSRPGSGVYDWSEELQGRILSSFYIGYIITHVPGGILADKFGCKWTLSLGILSTAVFTLITPYTVVHGGPTSLIVLRIFMGLGEGTTFPALSVLLAKWVPANERGKLGTLVLSGGEIGTIVTNLGSGLLIHAYDWTIVFYFFGGLSVLWFIIFTVLCYSDPRTHPFISQSELEYLAKELDHAGDAQNKHPTPWLAIMSSPAMLAVIAAQIGHDWGFYVMVTDLPKYLADVMGFSVKKRGQLSSFPFVFMWIISISSGFVADWIIKHEKMNTTNVRKLMTGVAAVAPAFFMIGASYAGCNFGIVVFCFCACMAFMGLWYAGMKLSPLDMSRNYAGSLMGITNGIGAITGVLAPYSVGVMTPNTTILEWRGVFWLAFAILNLSAVIYSIWASGEIQPFDDPETLKAYQEEKRARKAARAGN